MQNIARVLVHTESWKCRLSILEGYRQDRHNQKEHLTGCRNTGCLAQRGWTLSLLDGNHVYLAPSEDKKATWERDGKSMESSQRAIRRDPVVALSREAEAGRVPGRERLGQRHRKGSQPKRSLVFNYYCVNPPEGSSQCSSNETREKPRRNFSCVAPTTMRAHSIPTAHKMLLRESVSPISKKVLVDQMMDSVPDNSSDVLCLCKMGRVSLSLTA